MSTMLAQESIPLLEQGAVQFILFGVMVIGTYILIKITISK